MEVMNVAVCEGLREIFKQEWDKLYGATKGVWDDTFKSGNELYKMEKSRRHAKQYLNSYQSGKRSKWDSSALSDAILYSNALGAMRLAPHVFDKVNELRKLRNDLTHVHGPQHKISNTEFDKAYNKIQNCFKVLKLSTRSVEIILDSWKRKISINFGKMTYICLTIFVTGLLSSASYYWYTNSMTAKALTPFRILPVRPIHLVANRSRTVNAILEELYNLRIRSTRSLTYFYISGNPGSGKSQLARLIGQQYGLHNFPKDIFSDGIVFVMTLKASSAQNILESYADFARRVDCSDRIITNIMNSNKTKTKMKIQSLKTEIAKILKSDKTKYTWLLIVDNVVRMREVSSFLPQLENDDWQSGQVLITTQDMSSVPPNSSLIVHISVSLGMDPFESCEFLINLSGLVGNQEIVSKVANELDYQPLALASAAFYVKQVRESKASSQFTWRDFLQKLHKGTCNLTEQKLSIVNNQAYSLTMSSAVLLAIEKFSESDPVLKHAFTFLSFVSYEPITLDVVVSYVFRFDKNQDKEDIGLRILQCSLILSSDKQKSVSILLHRVTHDNIKLYIARATGESTKVPLNVLELLLKHKGAIGEIALIPHLKAFYTRANNFSSDTIRVRGSLKHKRKVQEQIFYLSLVLYDYGEFLTSKIYLHLGLTIATNGNENNKFHSASSLHRSFPKIGDIYSNLATLENKLGNSKQAIKYLKRASKIYSKQFGLSHKGASRCLRNVATGLRCYNPEECDEINKYSHLEPDTDESFENKGIFYINKGNKHFENKEFEEAKRCYLIALTFLRKIVDVKDNNPNLRSAKLNLAIVHMNMGATYINSYCDYEQAKIYLMTSIDLYKKFTGPNNLNLAMSYSNLGYSHFQLDEMLSAHDCFRCALKIYSQYRRSSRKMIVSLKDFIERAKQRAHIMAQQSYEQHAQESCRCGT